MVHGFWSRWRDDWFPELEVLDDDNERRELFHECQQNAWTQFSGLVIACLCVGVMHRFLLPQLTRWTGWSVQRLEVPFWLLTVMTTAGLALWISRQLIRKRIRSTLLERGYSVCLHCGYDLRGTETNRCPECWTEFDSAPPSPQASDRDLQNP
jgi:hypothetical protein